MANEEYDDLYIELAEAKDFYTEDRLEIEEPSLNDEFAHEDWMKTTWGMFDEQNISYIFSKDEVSEQLKAVIDLVGWDKKIGDIYEFLNEKESELL